MTLEGKRGMRNWTCPHWLMNLRTNWEKKRKPRESGVNQEFQNDHDLNERHVWTRPITWTRPEPDRKHEERGQVKKKNKPA